MSCYSTDLWLPNQRFAVVLGLLPFFILTPDLCTHSFSRGLCLDFADQALIAAWAERTDKIMRKRLCNHCAADELICPLPRVAKTKGRISPFLFFLEVWRRHVTQKCVIPQWAWQSDNRSYELCAAIDAVSLNDHIYGHNVPYSAKFNGLSPTEIHTLFFQKTDNKQPLCPTRYEIFKRKVTQWVVNKLWATLNIWPSTNDLSRRHHTLEPLTKTSPGLSHFDSAMAKVSAS